MRIHNETPYQAGWTTGFLQDGQELVTVVVKGSFSLRKAGELSERQRPLLESDEFGKDPAKDAPMRENDFAPRKPRCDVLLHACAYAPAGRRAARVEVGAVVGAMQKSFVVVGRRQWQCGVVSVRASAPEPFDQHRISYDSAFGGVDVDPEDPLRIHSYLQNPSGTGYSRSGTQLEGMALPRSEELKRSVADPSANYIPMAFGPIGRHWVPRLSYVGTYDEKWQNERLPFMPDDFNPLYFQAAPSNQQVDHIVGGERIVLANLCKEGRLQAEVPRQGVVVGFIDQRGNVREAHALCDTLTIEPDDDLLCMVWRATLPLERDLFELREMVVVPTARYSAARLRARAQRKTYYDNLNALVAERGKGGR